MSSKIDVISIALTAFSNLWPFFILVLIMAFLKGRWMKGKFGEAIVNTSNKLRLDKNIYRAVKDITLQIKDGSTTQIDHILVSKYGLFVIETKNMKGWIFGGEHQKQWTQQIFKEKNRFQNPLHQNYRHIKALEEILEIPSESLISIIVFVGDCEFKTDMPENIFCGLSYTKYIKSFNEERLNPLQLGQILKKLEGKRLKQGFRTDREHVKNLNQRKKASQNTSIQKKCNRCGSDMILRKNRKTNEEFYGCKNYPRCKHTLQV